MKKILFLTLIALPFSFSLQAQTEAERAEIISHYDLEKLNQLEAEFAEAFAREKQEAIEMAAIKGWPISYEIEGGGQALLVGIIAEDIPKYYETTNNNAGITARVNRLHTGGSTGLNLNGENMVIGVWDGGLVLDTHELISGRATNVDGAPTLSNHATHVTGTIIGNGTVQSGNAKGMAPLAQTLNYDFDNDVPEVLTAISSQGLLISNHSYGIAAGGQNALPAWYLGKYVTAARTWDQIAYNSPYHLSVLSAGNARNTSHNNQAEGGYDILTGNKNSKNSMVVAATFQVLNYTGPSSVNMSSFSSWGPTDDGRIKPDISAKGVSTFSSIATSNISYSTFSGSSMSSPSVAGSLALLQQHYNQLNGNFMRASTLRGLALHTADEAGITPGPDYRFGWGLINGERAALTISEHGNSSWIQEIPLGVNDFYTFTVKASQLETLMGSITWTDPAGPANSNMIEDDDTIVLVNDLDLRLATPAGSTFFPWILDHTNFTIGATTGDNIRDNIEKIEVPTPAGEYIVRISHKVNLFNNNPQMLSLILTGIDKEDFTVASHQGFKSICNTVNQVTFPVDVTVKNGFSDNINFTVVGQPSGTTATLSQTTLNGDGSLTLTVDNLAGTAAGTYMLKVAGVSSTETVNLYVQLQVLDGNFSPVTLVAPADNEVDVVVNPVLFWSTPDSFVQEYDVQIATDIGFNNIVDAATVTSDSYGTAILQETTEYFWRVRPKNDCGVGNFSSPYRFVTREPLGTDDFDKEKIKVYPNPTTDLLNIEALNTISKIEIYSVLGQKIGDYNPTSGKVQIDLSTLSPGSYFVKISVEDSSQVFQVIRK